MRSLSQALYQHCYDTLLTCSEFDSESVLRDVFVTEELVLYQSRLPESDSRERRVRSTIAYLVRQRLRGDRPVFPIFLAILRDGLPEGDALRDELEQLRVAVEDELTAPVPVTPPTPVTPLISTELRMPKSGETFLDRSDREWVVGTVDTVISPMSIDGIKNLLRDRLPDRLINRINFRDGSRNIAETIVGMLEHRGALTPPDYHALGAVLTEVAETDLVGYDAGVKIAALLFRYNLVKGRNQITELSSRFQVPSPVLSAEMSVSQSLSLTHLPSRLRDPQLNERLESLYNQGISHMLDVNFLISGAKAVRSVCRIEFDKRGEGTGFLIALDLILTNYHVMLPSAYQGDPNLRAKKCGVRFGAIKEKDGGVSAGRYFKLHDTWRVAESKPDELDYMLIRLERPITVEEEISPLPFEGQSIQKDTFVNIIQHPSGGPMEVSLRFNQVVAIEGDRVYYLADTEKGSSGSPVFDDEWRVVALHRSGGELDADGKLLTEANAGVPINSILRGIAPYLNS